MSRARRPEVPASLALAVVALLLWGLPSPASAGSATPARAPLVDLTASYLPFHPQKTNYTQNISGPCGAGPWGVPSGTGATFRSPPTFSLVTGRASADEVLNGTSCNGSTGIEVHTHLGLRSLKFTVPTTGIHKVVVTWTVSYRIEVSLHLAPNSAKGAPWAYAFVTAFTQVFNLSGPLVAMRCTQDFGEVSPPSGGTNWLNATNLTKSCTLYRSPHEDLAAGSTYEVQSAISMEFYYSQGSKAGSGTTFRESVDMSSASGLGAVIDSIRVY